MKNKVENAMDKVRLWQEECKLVMMFIGAVSAVAVFFSRLFKGEVGAMEVKGFGADMGQPRAELVSHLHGPDLLLIASALAFVVFTVLGVLLFVRILHRHMDEAAK